MQTHIQEAHQTIVRKQLEVTLTAAECKSLLQLLSNVDFYATLGINGNDAEEMYNLYQVLSEVAQ